MTTLEEGRMGRKKDIGNLCLLQLTGLYQVVTMTLVCLTPFSDMFVYVCNIYKQKSLGREHTSFCHRMCETEPFENDLANLYFQALSLTVNLWSFFELSRLSFVPKLDFFYLSCGLWFAKSKSSK